MDLKKLEQRAQAFDHLFDSVVVTDLEGIIIDWNIGSELLYGYTKEEAIGQPVHILHVTEDVDRITTEILTSVEKFGKWNGEIRYLHKDGHIGWIESMCVPLLDDNNQMIAALGINKEITARIKETKRLHDLAHHDALTGLPNRILFTDRLEQGIEKAKRHKEGLALFFIDLDKFKHINDSLGHGVGDKVLKVISKRLKNVIRKEDTLARLSGDEFTLIMEELQHPEDASLLADKILRTLAEAIIIDEHRLYVSGSIGISFYPQDAVDAQSLLKYADTAMYKAKEEGRNNYQYYSPQMTEFALKRMLMQTNLRQAIDKEEFVIHYQPQINASTNALVGVEALIRWEHPTMGVLMPDEFIPLAEETGMIVEIDQWVMRTAMKQVFQWYKEGLNPGRLGLNISVKHLDKISFIQKVETCLKRNDFNSKWLELEITEGQMMKKSEEVITKLQQINNLGIGISIDDFGTGYSSLSLLKRLPINRLKIDRSFVRDIPEDEEDVGIIKAIIALAGSLKLDIIAEGVETSEQRDFLIDNGCSNFQGHYYSSPMTEEEMHTMLLNHK